jgi:hypothetical protein
MHIIRPTQTQTIQFIPRVAIASPVVQIIDESQNKNISSDILNQSGSYLNGFTTLFLTFKVGKFPVEGRFYYFKAFSNNGNTLCYQDRLFCTAQTEYDKYTVNQNVYTEETSYDNEYIII